MSANGIGTNVSRKAYIRTDTVESKYELMVRGEKQCEFTSSELHEFCLQALSPLRWSCSKDFASLKEGV